MTDAGRGTRPATLGALLDDLARRLPDVRIARVATRAEWSRGGVAFAAIDDDALEVRLDGPIAAAALRTPDTGEASRGRPWVRFAPPALDDHAIDRATAWFELAYRRAAAT